MKSIIADRHPEILAVCGLVTIIAVSLQPLTAVRCGQMVFFMIFAGLIGKRVRLLPPAVMLITVVIANLFTPNGRVLFSFWRMDITFGALELGLMKASLLIGLIYVSRLSVGPDLRIPGRFGALFLKTFAYFEELTAKWPETRGDLLTRIDDLLERVEEDNSVDDAQTGVKADNVPGDGTKSSSQRSSKQLRRNTISAAILVLAGWGPYIVAVLIG